MKKDFLSNSKIINSHNNNFRLRLRVNKEGSSNSNNNRKWFFLNKWTLVKNNFIEREEIKEIRVKEINKD
jgi:hypothetical protein